MISMGERCLKSEDMIPDELVGGAYVSESAATLLLLGSPHAGDRRRQRRTAGGPITPPLHRWDRCWQQASPRITRSRGSTSVGTR